MLTLSSPSETAVQARFALALRVWQGTLFVIGGWAKLSRLLSPSEAAGIVAEYMGPLGYINETFQQFLFSGSFPGFVTPWSFLTLLSTFELVSGLMLVAGLMVRPLCLIWVPLLWSFVFSLPVVTTPGVVPGEATYTSPALFVQIRDVTLSGLFAVLLNLGSGARSVDGAYGLPAARGRPWDGLGYLLRVSLGLTFLVGGAFHGYHKVMTFGEPQIVLIVIGLALIAGVAVRAFAVAACAVLLWYMASKIGGASGLLGYANSVKREIALLTGTGVLAYAGGGSLYRMADLWASLRDGAQIYWRNPLKG